MFWERFKNLLKEKNINQKDIAELCNLTTGAVSSWKHGFIPQTNTLKKIADYFNVSTDYLLGYTDKKYTIENEEISEEQKHLLEKYNNAPIGIKMSINKLLDID